MKKFLLSLAAVALASSAWAAEYTATFSSDNLNAKTFTGSQTLTYDGMDWKLDVTKLNQNYYFAKDNTKGLQIGSAKQSAETVTISSESFSGSQIQQVAVEMSQGGKASFSGTITVGNYSKNVTITKDNVSYETDFTGVESGKIEINLTNSTTSKTDNGAFYIKSITVTYLTEDDEKSPAGLSFPETEYTANLGEIFTAPELTKATTADVVYKSSKPEVATVDAATGAVKLVAAGKTTITATSEANDTYKAGKAEYTLIVTDPNAIIDILNPENTLKPGTYTSSESYTSELTGIVYKSQTYSSKGYQFNKDKTGSGIAVSNNSNGYTIKKITITPKSGLTESQANNGVKIYAGNTAYSTGSTNGTEIGNPKGSEEIVIIPDADYSYFSIVHNGGVYIIAEIQIEWNAPKTNEKKDFDLTMVLKGSEGNEDIKTVLGEFDDEFHYYMPEGNQDFEFEFNLAEGLTYDMFKDMATWKITNESTSADVTNDMLLPEGTWATIYPKEAGTYRIYFDLKENEHYITAGSDNYFVHVYPHVDQHFAYDDLEINSCVDNSGVLKLSKFETTNDGNYTYYYKVVNSGAATLSAEEEGYTKYNHETGVNLGAGTHTIEFIAEKNGVKSLKPKTLSVSVATSVEAIGAEAGEAVYFDLQGRRVNGQPEQGLYIVRQGGKTSKVFL